MEEDWDLQAVVRGCKAEGEPSSSTSRDLFSFPTTSSPSSSCLQLQEQEEDLLLYFPDLTSNKTVLQELQELCEPFLRRGQPPMQPQKPQPQAPAQPLPRSKRRKNQQKKVVCQVPADGVSADMWAWRKYGQKPIKGSPFPRGYYRCSSSKGCPARKQVERSRTDPGTFIITYTAEHNHPVPTHRNSLAGSTRHKIVPAAATTKANEGSPPAQLSPSTEDKKEEEIEEQEQELDEEDGLLMVGDMDMLGKDEMMFVDFDERGLTEGFSTVFSSSLWAMNNTTAAAGSG